MPVLDQSRDVTPVNEGSDLESGLSTPVKNTFLSQLRVGCTIWALAPDKGYRKAEIRALSNKDGENSFYVHFQDFNKRLDEWINASRIDSTRGPEWPKTTDKKRLPPSKAPLATPKHLVGKRPKNSRDSTPIPKGKFTKKSKSSGASTPTPSVGNEEEIKAVGDNDGEEELDLEENKTDTPAGIASKEEEIENLRTSGSMTQNIHEVSRVKNFNKIQIGKHLVEAWYFSPWPIELTSCDTPFICEFCFSFFGSPKQFERHRQKCTMFHPPGNEIYRDGTASFWEIDGRKQRTWCRNLCLLSKAFLDHKTLHFDVDPFLFYCMTIRDQYGNHLVGYFSKEKESAENYNVACILTLPQYQRHGYGRLLIQFSYELSKREGKSGSPEKPLSDLGLLSYRAYWADTLIDLIMNSSVEITIDELAQRTSMTTQDVLHTLQNLNMLKYYKGQHIIYISDEVEKAYDKWKKKRKRFLDPEGLATWKAPVFTPAQLRFSW